MQATSITQIKVKSSDILDSGDLSVSKINVNHIAEKTTAHKIVLDSLVDLTIGSAIIAGNGIGTFVQTNVAQQSTSSATWVTKGATLTILIAGTHRLALGLQVTTGEAVEIGRIKKNGIVVATFTMNHDSTDYYRTADVICAVGDVITAEIQAPAGGTAYCYLNCPQSWNALGLCAAVIW